MRTEDPFPDDPETRSWRDFYGHVVQRQQVHNESAVRRCRRYKRMATALHLALPVSALSLTVVVTLAPELALVTVGSVLVTVLTALNSILSPEERYLKYADFCIQLHDWRFELDTELEDVKATPAEAVQVVRRYNSLLSDIGRQMAGTPIPKLQV